MLELKNIVKIYKTGDEKVEALKGVSLKFRKSEFVSILGPSGCGKTTLLNIIGGLDRYTSGDLIINGKSTKDFKNRDWDSYRNYSVGFVFQSYNLIGHQSVLANVELALTISGISKKERRQRAIKALEDVGLKDQIHKKPNQLSGGQMQRVAIARALVNNPDIILADEPTGALDTKTSVQIMEILKEISKNKLIIMVTHNPELAEKYSSRIIKILDGTITEDSRPFIMDFFPVETVAKKFKRTSMKFFTAFRLSLNNLMTKKARTILTSFAGSIGIIGIALILAISTGIQTYIDTVEEDTLSSYPLTIEQATVDMSSMLETMMGDSDKDKEGRDENRIYSSDIMTEFMSVFSSKVNTNNLTELKKYIETTDNKIKNNCNAISYGYDLTLNLYNPDTSDNIVQVNPSTVIESMMEGAGPGAESRMPNTAMGSSFMSTDSWTELIDNRELLKSQYDLIAGKWPENFNEVILIVSQDNEISEYTLYTLGLKDQRELAEKMKKIQNGEEIEKDENISYSYDELVGLSYKLILNSDYYEKSNDVWVDKSDDDEYMKSKIAQAEDITVVGIIRLNDQTVASGESGLIGYTKDLKEYVINKTNEAEIVKAQKDNPDVNVFSGLAFPKEGEEEKFDITTLTPEEQMQFANMSKEEFAQLMEVYAQNEGATYESNLLKLGSVNIEEPSSISIYPKDFESKDLIIEGIEEYNDMQTNGGKDENTISYNDVVGTMMKSVNQIINIISYVLIAFVSVSLIVSSIMIGIITYISVLERTKEIGVLRAIGASKKDISRVFNAETLIVGFVSGVIGIGVTVLLTLPINAIIFALTGVAVKAFVPIPAAIILVLLSMFLTAIAGLIPSRIASNKDPVIALRSE